MRNSSSPLPTILTILLVVVLCCLCIALILFASGALLITRGDSPPVTTPMVIDQPLPHILQPTTAPTPTTRLDPTPALPPDQIPAMEDTLEILNQAVVPINDPIELAKRLGGKGDLPKTFLDPNAPYQLGDSKAFWVTNVDNNENFQVIATVRYLGDHTYFWIENGVTYDPADLLALGDAFDQQIYPTTRAFFSTEWSPGADHDPRIHILYAGGLGESLAGYFSSSDQLHPDAHEFSNAKEMFLINADNIQLWHNGIYTTLAHELQHMIHWHIDKNEETWLNEGFSMLAEIVNGYDPGGFDRLYLQDTDLQLTDWGSNIGQNGPHYGASMLFTAYFYDRFGEALTQALVAEQKNGMESIDVILADHGIHDPLTGEIITSQDVFADWAVTNLLGDPAVADGRYHYSVYPQTPLAAHRTHITTCPTELTAFEIAQFGVDYIKISCSGELTLSFDGQTTTNLLPVNPYSGEVYFWSNQGDHSNMHLQRTFDLTEVSGPVSMTYQTWYDLEADYDYVFVSASTDEKDWDILNTTSCTFNNPSGNSYGCGLNGASDGWQLETLDLSPYAGGEVTIRFDYVTDAAVNGEGLVIDDIRIAAIDYFTDFEQDDGGWVGEGFVRINNTLPQFFRVTLVTFGDQVTVRHIDLDAMNQAQEQLRLGDAFDSLILVVSGTTPYTRQRAAYHLQIKTEP
ncbi:MAG: hypothetical protein ACNA70_04805 [Brevefilum sp.]